MTTLPKIDKPKLPKITRDDLELRPIVTMNVIVQVERLKSGMLHAIFDRRIIMDRIEAPSRDELCVLVGRAVAAASLVADLPLDPEVEYGRYWKSAFTIKTEADDGEDTGEAGNEGDGDLGD